MSHRHGYKGRKFGRETDQRRALIKGLASELVEHGAIVTTIEKAKELTPYINKLVTKAKKADLHSRRQLISSLSTETAAHKLMDEVAPKLNARTSGYTRIERLDARRGDLAVMARISFVDDLTEAPVAKTAVAKTEKEVAAKPTAKKAVTRKRTSAKKEAA